MRHPLRRIVTTLWALWFVLLVSEPALFHVCPMHDGAASTEGGAHAAHGGHAAAATVHAASAHASHDAHADHAAHGADRAMHTVASTDQPPAENDSHGCSCLGDCAATAAVAVAEAPRWGWLAGVVDVETRHATDADAPRASVDHLLPFANGPPVTVRA